MDPNTLNLDPDPGFWPNLDPDPGLYNQFWKKKFKIILEKNNFLWNKYIFLNYKNKLSPKEIFNQLGLWIVSKYLKSYIFCLHFNLYLHIWIRIRIPNTNPDPGSSWIWIQYGSGSSTLIKNKNIYLSKRNS